MPCDRAMLYFFVNIESRLRAAPLHFNDQQVSQISH